MSWIDPADGWTGKRCIVCNRFTSEWVAPLGIVSGRVRCHVVHPDVEIKLAYFKWADEVYGTPQSAQDALDL
jgi:hypothetical protein